MIKFYRSNPISQLLSAGRRWQKLAVGLSSFKQDFFLVRPPADQEEADEDSRFQYHKTFYLCNRHFGKI